MKVPFHPRSRAREIIENAVYLLIELTRRSVDQLLTATHELICSTTNKANVTASKQARAFSFQRNCSPNFCNVMGGPHVMHVAELHQHISQDRQSRDGCTDKKSFAVLLAEAMSQFLAFAISLERLHTSALR